MRRGVLTKEGVRVTIGLSSVTLYVTQVSAGGHFFGQIFDGTNSTILTKNKGVFAV